MLNAFLPESDLISRPDLTDLEKYGVRVYEVKRNAGAGKSNSLPFLPESALVGKFRSLPEFLAYLPVHMPHPDPQHKGHDSSETDSNNWAGGFTYAKALTTFTHNPKSVRKFTEKDALLSGGDTGLAIEYDVTGDALDLGKYMAGEPECFSALLDGVPRGRYVRILYNLSIGSYVDPDDVLVHQKRLVRLVDWLEAQNVRVSLTTIDSAQCWHTECVIKDYHDPLDLNHIAVVAHPSFFRRLLFRFGEHSKTIRDGYGNATHLHEHVMTHLGDLKSELNQEVTVYVGNQFRNTNTQYDNLEAKLAEVLSDPNGTNADVLTVLT